MSADDNKLDLKIICFACWYIYVMTSAFKWTRLLRWFLEQFPSSGTYTTILRSESKLMYKSGSDVGGHGQWKSGQLCLVLIRPDRQTTVSFFLKSGQQTDTGDDFPEIPNKNETRTGHGQCCPPTSDLKWVPYQNLRKFIDISEKYRNIGNFQNIQNTKISENCIPKYQNFGNFGFLSDFR